MVKIDALRFSENEIRALFETVASHCAEDLEGVKPLIQNQAVCRLHIPAHILRPKKARGCERLPHFCVFQVNWNDHGKEPRNLAGSRSGHDGAGAQILFLGGC